MELISLLMGDGFFLWLGELLHSEVIKMTVSFVLAARLHRAWVKKDMNEQFDKITKALDHVGTVMSERIDGLDRRIQSLEKRPS